MQILTEILEKAEQLSNQIEEAILDDDFKIIHSGKHTTTVEVLGLTVEVWMVNTPDDTEISGIIYENKNWRYPAIPFKNPHGVRNSIIAFGIGKDENETEDHY